MFRKINTLYQTEKNSFMLNTMVHIQFQIPSAQSSLQLDHVCPGKSFQNLSDKEL